MGRGTTRAVVTTGLILLSLTLLGAAWLLAHLALLVGVWRAEKPTTTERWLALLPPLLPLIALRAGLKVGTVVWAVLLVGYVALRFVG